MKKLLLFAILFLPSIVSAQAIKQGTTSSAGDAGSNIPLCVASAASGTLNTEGKYGYCSVDLEGNLRTTASFSFSGGTADATKLEDTAHSTGDRGNFILGVADDNTPSPTTSTAGEYAAPAIAATTGALQISVIQAFQSSAGGGLLNLEEAVHGSGDAGVVTLERRLDTVAPSSATTGRLVVRNQDARGLSYTNPWGADSSEWFRACSGSDVTGTTATEIKAAVASKYHYLTSVNCTNTDASVNTRVNIVEETAVATEILWMLNLAAVTGSDGMKFDPPLKAAAVNKNIGVTPITTSAEVRCCVEGFVSAN